MAITVDQLLTTPTFHLTARAKCKDNTHNKGELIQLLSLTFRKHQITMEQCDSDADTSIVRVAPTDATDDFVEVMYNFLYIFIYIA